MVDCIYARPRFSDSVRCRMRGAVFVFVCTQWMSVRAQASCFMMQATTIYGLSDGTMKTGSCHSCTFCEHIWTRSPHRSHDFYTKDLAQSNSRHLCCCLYTYKGQTLSTAVVRPERGKNRETDDYILRESSGMPPPPLRQAACCAHIQYYPEKKHASILIHGLKEKVEVSSLCFNKQT